MSAELWARVCRDAHVAVGFDAAKSCPLCAVLDYVRVRATCPCCEATLDCDPECTFATDAPSYHAQMVTARDVLREVSA